MTYILLYTKWGLNPSSNDSHTYYWFLKITQILDISQGNSRILFKKTNGHSVLPPFGFLWLCFQKLCGCEGKSSAFTIFAPGPHRRPQKCLYHPLWPTWRQLSLAQGKLMEGDTSNHLRMYKILGKTHRINTSVDGGLDLQRWSLRPLWLQQAVPPLAFQNQHPFVTSNVISGCSTMVLSPKNHI